MIELKCSKCAEEDHEGHFCRCVPRNIQLAKELRETGHYMFKKLEVRDIIENLCKGEEN
jgi:hypothetical protein